ncbi:MAG: lytic transglycosylase [Alphaproteobacteria bacterium]|nr:lytic transglycosylase [Alphaproteobacteria bacterium]
MRKDDAAAVAALNGPAPKPPSTIAWGKKVTKAFKQKVIAISGRLQCDPSHLMAAMAFETGESFRPDIVNAASGATGLIQFIPATAEALGTSTAALKAMTAPEQLDWVEKYLKPFLGRMGSVSDVYMTILWPRAVGMPDATVIFPPPQKAYEQNKGLDANKDGQVTKGEAAAKVYAKLTKGLSKEWRG